MFIAAIGRLEPHMRDGLVTRHKDWTLQEYETGSAFRGACQSICPDILLVRPEALGGSHVTLAEVGALGHKTVRVIALTDLKKFELKRDYGGEGDAQLLPSAPADHLASLIMQLV